MIVSCFSVLMYVNVFLLSIDDVLISIDNIKCSLLFQVTHTVCSKAKPSIAAVVGSCDPTGTRYAARLCDREYFDGNFL